jgi:hypothetical protein
MHTEQNLGYTSHSACEQVLHCPLKALRLILDLCFLRKGHIRSASALPLNFPFKLSLSL